MEGNVLFNDTVTTTEDGTVPVTYTPVTGSAINITAVFDGNPEENVYNGNESSTTVTPEQMSTKLVLNSTDTIVDGTSIIGINVTDANDAPVNGTVNLTVTDDKGNEYTVLVPVENGIGTYTYPSNQTDMGKVVSVTGYYVENETLGYAASPEADTEFDVAKLNTTVDLVVNNATITNFTVNITVTGKDTDRTVEDGPVVIYANGTKVGEAEIVDGKADNVLLDITEIGDYTLTVEYGGNEVFNENDTFATDVTAIKINTTTTVEIKNNTVGNVTLEAVVKDVNGNIVTEGVVNITAVDEDGNEYYIGEAEIVDGKAVIKNDTLTGNEEYVFTANYEGTPKYNISNGTTTEEIVTRPTTTTIEVLNNTFENVTVKVTVVDDETGQPIPEGDVVITLPNGTTITVKTDENGENVTTFDDIPVGNDKEFDANYLGNDTYSPSDDTTTTDILKRPSTTTPVVINNTAGNVTLNVHVTDLEDGRDLTEGTVTIYAKLQDEDDESYVPVGTGSIDEKGMTTIITNITEKGNYTFKAEFEGNTNYTESDGTVDDEVVGRLADIGATPGNTTLGNSTVIVSLNDTTTGEPLVNATVIITLPDGSEVNGTIGPDGTVEVPVDLPVGNYTLSVRYDGNETYNATNTTVDIEILPRPSEITGEIINNVAKNVTINATVVDAETKQPVPNGPVVAKLNGTVIGTGEVVDGTAIIPTDLDTIGNFTVDLEYLGNENYTESNNAVDVEVVGRLADIDATPGNTTLGNSTVIVNLTDDETGEPLVDATVIITLPDGSEVNGTIGPDGTVEVPVDLPVGNYTLSVRYDGNETYNATNTTVDIEILPRPSEITGEVINNTVGNVTINATVTDAETGEPVPNGPVVAKVNGTVVGTGEVVDGTAIIPTDLDKIGEYDVELEYLGNENYTESNTTIPVDVVGRPSDITGIPGNETLGNSTVNVTLVDPETGEPIPNAPVIVTLPDGTQVNGTTDENGTVEIPVDLPVGPSTLNVTFPGDETYNGSTTTVDMNILPRPSEITGEVIDNVARNVTINATVVDAETKQPVPNGPVVARVNGTVIGEGEVVDGIAIIPTNLDKAGNYDVELEYLGNGNYTESSTTIPVEVVGRESEITGEPGNETLGNSTVIVNLTDPETGEPIPNATVIVTLPDGTEVNGTTDENGTVEIPVDLPVGPSTLNVTFPGDETYNGSTTTVDMNILPRPSEITGEVTNNTVDNVTIVATVTDAETGELVPNGTVIAKINGTEIGRATVTDGIANIVTNIDTIGIYDIDLEYSGNEVYSPSNTTLDDVEVVGRIADITEVPDNTTLGNTTVNVTLIDEETGKPIPNAPVDIIVNDTVVGRGITDEEGKATIPVDLPVGEHNLTAVFNGNDRYNSTNTTTTMTVEPRPSQIEAEVINNTVGNVTIVATVTDAETGENVPNGPVEIYVDDELVGEGIVEDGKVTIVTSIKTPGNYTFDVKYLGNENYTSSETALPAKVITHPSDIEPEVMNNTIGNTSIRVTLTDPDTGDRLINKPVIVTLPDGTNITGQTDDNGVLELPLDLPAGEHELTITFLGDDTYRPSIRKLPLTINKRDAILTPTVKDVINDTSIVEIAAVDSETGKPIINGTIELTLPDGTKVQAITDDEGIATFYNVPVPEKVNDYDAKLIENPVYNEAETNVTIEKETIKPSDIEPEIMNNIVGNTSIRVTLTDPDTGDRLINKPVIVTLPDGTNITGQTDDNGVLELPLDLPAGENELTITFPGDDTYKAATKPLVVDVVKRNATLTPTVVNKTTDNAVVEIAAIDELTGEPVVNATIELTLPDGTKVQAITDENGIATFPNVPLNRGLNDLNATLLENPVYNRADTNLSIRVPLLIRIGNWTLVRVNVSAPADDTDDVDEPVIPSKPQFTPKVKQSYNNYPRYAKNNGYNKYNNYNRHSRYNRYNKRPSWNRPGRHYPPVPAMTKAQYILFIQLYAQFLEGDMSFSDFVAILKINGVEIDTTAAWDENGLITLVYDDLSEVPDSIEIQDNSGHYEDYSSNIDKNNAPSSSGEIDSGDIQVESKSPAKSSQSSASSHDSAANSEPASVAEE